MSDLLYLVNETRELMLEIENALTGDHDPQSIEHSAIAALALRHLHERRLELADDTDEDGPAELERPLTHVRVLKRDKDDWGPDRWVG